MIDNIYIKKDLENIYSRNNIDWDKFDNTKVLLTGAYGMLASYVVLLFAYLREEKGINVSLVCVVRTKSKFEKKFGIDFCNRFSVEIIESDLIEALPKDINPDYVIHAASLANPNYYGTNPVEVIEPNIIGTYNLLKSLGSNIKSFLFFSSGDVYGATEKSGAISENDMGCLDPLAVRSCYGESKRMGETLCAAFYREYNIPTRIVRIGHTYGPTMDIENDPRVFSSMLKCLLNVEDIEIKSDGLAKRPFCYIADAIAAYITVLLLGNEGEAYNVCNTKEFLSINEFAKIVASLDLSNSVKVIHTNRSINDNYVPDSVNIANCPIEDKLISLGWNSEYSTYDGLKNTYNYLKEF